MNTARPARAAMAALALLAGSVPAVARAEGRNAVPKDAEIRALLARRIDVERQGVGIVVGVIDHAGRRIIAYGARAAGDRTPLDGETVFEIGSMTKVFTSLLLEEAVLAGAAALDDPVAKYLPADASVPTRGGRSITLIDLATHTSGLPRLPANLAPKDPSNPYADYTDAQLFAFLKGYELPRDIGAKYEYSNLGAGLLGQALSRRAGLSYEALAKRDILEPLHMTSTGVVPTPSMKARMAIGHTGALAPTPYWDLPTLSGAGALRSDADDLLTFLAAELGYLKTPLYPAMRAQWTPRRPTGRAGTEVSLGWHVRAAPGGEIIWHNGGTGGFRTFMGFDPKAGLGVVVLTNAATETGGDDIGFHLLTGSPLAAPPKEHTAIVLPAGAVDHLTGRFEAAPIGVLDVTREGERLFARPPNGPSLELTPESATVFFNKAANAELTFEIGPDGRAAGIVIRQGGADVHARRLP